MQRMQAPISEAYKRSTEWVAGNSLAPPGRERPLREGFINSTKPTQQRRHAAWCPPGFDVVRAERDDKVRLFDIARGLRHPLAKVEVRVPQDMREAVRLVCRRRERIHDFRRLRLEAFERHAAALERDSSAIRARQPAHVAAAAGPAHVAMLASIVDGIGWPYVDFPRDYGLRGHDIVGEVADTGLWRARSSEEMSRARREFVDPSELFVSNASWNMRLAAQSKSEWLNAKRSAEAGDTSKMEALRAAWGASVKEVDQKGTAEGPLLVSTLNERYGWGKWRGCGRHAIWQSDKYRPVDNMRRNKLNRVYLTREAAVMAGPDTQVSIGRLFAEEADEVGLPPEMLDLGGGADDEPDAYRHSATRTPQYTPVLLANPDTGEVRGFVPHGHNFGLAAAIVNYCSKPELVCAVLRRLFAVPAEHMVDDYSVVEPAFARGDRITGPARGGEAFPYSGQGVLWRVCHVLGFALAVLKHAPWNRQSPFCGVVTDFRYAVSRGVVLLRCKPTTVEKLRDMVERVVEADELTPAGAASLRGKCGWVWLLGKVGRARLKVLADRQYRKDEGDVDESAPAFDDGVDDASGGGMASGSWPLGPVLRESLLFLKAMLAGALPDVVYSLRGRDEPPVVALSDAMWRPDKSEPLLGWGTVAWVLWIPLSGGGGKLAYAHAQAPRWLLQHLYDLREQKTLIIPLEAVGIAGTYFSKKLESSIRGKDILHFADNKAANAGAAKGYSGAADLARIVSALHSRWAELGIDPWVEFVKSEANIADEPSRGFLDTLIAMGGVEVPFDFPPIEVWS